MGEREKEGPALDENVKKQGREGREREEGR